MTVQVQWDDDPAKTGLPDAGSDSKTYPGTATSGTVTVTSEQDPTNSVTVPFTLPLTPPSDATITSDKTTVDSSGDATERTITVSGTGFPASTAGTVTLNTGAAGSGGTVVATVPVTTDASGSFTGAAVVVPVDQAAGDYHLVGTVGAANADANPITVTSGGGAPALSPDKTTVDSSGDATERTITVDGSGFEASTAGTVTLHAGAPGAGGAAIVTANVTTDASGTFTGALIEVPVDQAAGDYHLVGTVGAAVSDDTAITVTAEPPVEPEVTPDVTELAAGETLTATGSGFPASTAGRVSLFDATDTEVVGADVTTDASGGFAGTPLVVPAETAAGELQLRATVGAVTSADVPITVTEAPIVAPDNVALSNIGPASIQVDWDEVVGATGYAIWYKPTSETAWMVAGEVTAPTLNGTVTGLSSETSYDFAVATLIDSEMSDRSATVTDSTIAGGAALPQAVAAAGTPTATSVPLTWDAVPDAAGYQIRWREAADSDWSASYGSEDGASTGTSMEGLTAGTSYLFGVRAMGDGTTNTSGPWTADIPATTAAAMAAARKRAAKKRAN